MKRSSIITFLIVRTIGNFLILLVLFGFFATFGPIVYYEAQYRFNQIEGVHYEIAEAKNIVPKKPTDSTAPANFKPTEAPAPDLLSSSKDRILVPIATDFSVIIPKLGIDARVFPNVDPGSPNEFLPVLQKGVAHAKGTAFPGMEGTTYLFAHSTDNFWNVGRYNAIFFLIKELTPNDMIVVYFNNKRYDYLVSDQKVVDATDTSYLNANLGKGDLLILQTCWPPGTTWKRLLVFAKLKGNSNEN